MTDYRRTEEDEMTNEKQTPPARAPRAPALTEREKQLGGQLVEVLNNISNGHMAVMRVLYDGRPHVAVVDVEELEDGMTSVTPVCLVMTDEMVPYMLSSYGEPLVENEVVP